MSLLSWLPLPLRRLAPRGSSGAGSVRGAGMLPPAVRLGNRRQLQALFYCWLCLHGHVLGSPLLAEGRERETGSNSNHTDSGSFSEPQHDIAVGAHKLQNTLIAQVALDSLADRSPGLIGSGGSDLDLRGVAGPPPFTAQEPKRREPRERRLRAEQKEKTEVDFDGRHLAGVFDPPETKHGVKAVEGRALQTDADAVAQFQQAPYVNVVIFDSHDANCDRNYDAPPITDENEAGFPQDGTEVLRKQNLACGIAPARFVFFTSDLADYTDDTVVAKIQIRITCKLALFIESDTCENVLDATGNFPAIDGCRFMANSARIILSTRLVPNHKYSITMKLLMPAGEFTASENSYDMAVEFYEMRDIEVTRQSSDITYTKANAKDESTYTDPYSTRGYLTQLAWEPKDTYSPVPGELSTYTFGLRSFGTMGANNMEYVVDVIAHPTDIWRFGFPDTACDGFASPPGLTVLCVWQSFFGAPATETNGFRLTIKSTPWINLAPPVAFSLRWKNPLSSVNMYWMATSYRFDNAKLPTEPYSVFVDKPIAVTGSPVGSIVKWELAAVNTEQWVTVEFSPGNSLQPHKSYSGYIVIIPPGNFTVVASSDPQDPEPAGMYNVLPCTRWPLEDLQLGRWGCYLADKALFNQTVYRVRVKVINPPDPGAAVSWRTEVWPANSVKYVSGTQSLRGLAISGNMEAALAQQNQLISGRNTLRIEFRPTTDVGTATGTSLLVNAPAGFLIIKRCVQFTRVELPECDCIGSDGNSFRLVFTVPDALKADVKYIFEIDVDNPDMNVPERDNFWTFDTRRPDGISVDTARYDGFFLFPHQFANFLVFPASRRVGSQKVVVRFIAARVIEQDDYIRIRAPDSVHWHRGGLQFATTKDATDAFDLFTKAPEVRVETPNVLLVQIAQACIANTEYGISANVIVPPGTPVPNRWWIEQFHQSGLPAPDNWRYIASYGAEGYETQVLINTKVEPFNVVKEAWQNPTLIVFEGTVTTYPRTRTTALGVVPVYPEFYVEAPPLFTYICPTSRTVFYPAYTVPLPANAICEVDHNDEQRRNQLHIYFPDGIFANTRYAFTIDLVNGPYIDPTTNIFKLQTRIDEEVVEDATLPGFLLADRMDNTRYLPMPFFEDRRVEAMTNSITFIIGTERAMDMETVLEVRAPPGFVFAFDCTDRVRSAGVDVGGWVGTNVAELPLPEILLCQSLARVDVLLNYTAQMQMARGWGQGKHALQVDVQNPTFTPDADRNFWGFTIYERVAGVLVPEMSEAWVWGFEIQVVLMPSMFAYNAGQTVLREYGINRVDIQFQLTTSFPTPGNDPEYSYLQLKAPEGFFFPNVCRDFTRDTGAEGMTKIPDSTTCKGAHNGRIMELRFPEFYALFAKTWYQFRFLVINPSDTFVDVTSKDRTWHIETMHCNAEFREDMCLDVGNCDCTEVDRVEVDRNSHLASFEMHERLSYFTVETLSRVGLNTTIFRFHFRTTFALPPQQTISIVPPLGTMFYGLRDGMCLEEDPQLVNRLFPTPLVSGVTRMPEWMSCQVVSPQEIRLTNTESVLGGRPLIAEPIFQFFLKNVTNARKTPALNMFRITANTMAPMGKEVWIGEAWVIFPELQMTQVTSSNPGFGLFTTFTFRMSSITEVPERGFINVTAPADYYFGPLISTPETAYNPLSPYPPEQDALQIRPGSDEVIPCTIMLPSTAPFNYCPFDFRQCRIERKWQSLLDVNAPLRASEEADLKFNRGACAKLMKQCLAGDYSSNIVECYSQSTSLELKLMQDVFLPADIDLMFDIYGYNAREPYYNVEQNTWHMKTMNSDSQRTVFDEKGLIPGLKLIGIVSVPSVIPGDTKVDSIENYVTITIILSVPCAPRALLRIVHPIEFRRNANAANSGSAIETGSTFPNQVEKRQTLNIIELECLEEQIPAGIPMEITIGLSNPGLSPPRRSNKWTIEAFSYTGGFEELLNCNYDIEGFKIFGQFSIGAIAGSVLSPTAQNVVGAWFMLKSKLPRTDKSEMKIYMPRGYTNVKNCGGEAYSFEYNANLEGVKDPHPPEKTYFPIPPGTYCYPEYDAIDDLMYVRLEIDNTQFLDYGYDYAFEFAVMNPDIPDEPFGEENVWRFETLLDGVILHLEQNIEGFQMEQIKVAKVIPGDTTSLLPLNRITFSIMSDKYIPGGSKIVIKAPYGFTFLCAFFRTDEGLSNTTTCYVKEANVAEFTIDSQDPKRPETPFKLFVYLQNPEFTPQNNYWGFDIISPVGVFIDVKDKVQSFDITGRVMVDIFASFPYIGETNRLFIQFVQSTIMNKADDGNEIVITAPVGYLFGLNISKCYLRLTNPGDSPEVDENGYANEFTFPPPGVTCGTFNNRTFLVRMPSGHGLLRNNYTLEANVENPGYVPNTSNTWGFITRVRNEMVGERIVDANMTLDGFVLKELLPLRTDEGRASAQSALMGLWICWLAYVLAAFGIGSDRRYL